jgi:hypothetical protein
MPAGEQPLEFDIGDTVMALLPKPFSPLGYEKRRIDLVASDRALYVHADGIVARYGWEDLLEVTLSGGNFVQWLLQDGQTGQVSVGRAPRERIREILDKNSWLNFRIRFSGTVRSVDGYSVAGEVKFAREGLEFWGDTALVTIRYRAIRRCEVSGDKGQLNGEIESKPIGPGLVRATTTDEVAVLRAQCFAAFEMMASPSQFATGTILISEWADVLEQLSTADAD